MLDKNYDLAVALRHELHSHPELSMQETWTKQRLMDFIREHTSLEVVDRGRWFYALHRAENSRSAIAFRADMDAIPVEEAPDFVPYASRNPGVGHKCGHDGHSATLAAFALELDKSVVQRDVYLIFQHAEEIGQGGEECARLLREKNISEIYAFHNLPGVPYGTAAVWEEAAQFASTGMILSFEGLKSHASYPEDGRNPAFAIGEMLTRLPALTRPDRWKGLTMATVIQVAVGERAFGTSAGHGELLLTVRGEYETEMDTLCQMLEDLARQKAREHGLTVSVAYEDRFPETRNHPCAVARIRDAARQLGIPLAKMKTQFRASEDFGYYTKEIPGAIFYLGSGDCPPLHTTQFDFPDGLIRPAVDMFLALVR